MTRACFTNKYLNFKGIFSMSKKLKLSLSAVCLLTLAGCAQITSVPPGTSLKDVEKQFGNPAVTCDGPNGTLRAVWSQMPDGELAWATTVDAKDKVGTFTQIMSVKAFDVLNTGTWSSSQVRCEFGPPAAVHVFPNKPNQSVWEYRFLDETDNFMMVFVNFETATNTVLRFSVGPDPEFNIHFNGK
jgi:hypothetical protein